MRRKVIDSNMMGEVEDNAKTCVAIFGIIDKGMPASIVYVNEDKLVFKDYLAEYDKYST